jgi:hypothetical protein
MSCLMSVGSGVVQWFTGCLTGWEGRGIWSWTWSSGPGQFLLGITAICTLSMTSFPGYALGHQGGHTRVKGDLTHAHTHINTEWLLRLRVRFGSHHSWRAAYSSAHKRTKRTALRKLRLRNWHAVKQQCGGRDGGRKGEGRTSALLRRFCGSLGPLNGTVQWGFFQTTLNSLPDSPACFCVPGWRVRCFFDLFRRCTQMAASFRVQSNKTHLNIPDSQTRSSEELKSTRGLISIVLLFLGDVCPLWHHFSEEKLHCWWIDHVMSYHSYRSYYGTIVTIVWCFSSLLCIIVTVCWPLSCAWKLLLNSCLL